MKASLMDFKYWWPLISWFTQSTYVGEIEVATYESFCSFVSVENVPDLIDNLQGLFEGVIRGSVDGTNDQFFFPLKLNFD